MKNIKFIRQMNLIVQKYRILISVILGIFVALGIKIKFFNETNTMGFVSAINDTMYLVFCVGICLLIYYSSKIKNTRLWTVSVGVGIIFAICYFLGDLQNDYIYTYIPTSKMFLLYSIIKLLAYFILFTNLVSMLFNKLPILVEKFNTKKEWKFFTNNKKSLFLVALIFFISYIPYFLYYFPGNINVDSMGSLYQITGMKSYSNFQPILYTLILGGFWNFGKMIFGTSTAGIATYVIFQMMYTSIVFSIILYYMSKRKIDKKWRIITFLFFILNPLNAWFTVRVEKGMLFHLTLILVIIGIIDIVHEKEGFFKKIWKPILLGIVTIVMIFLRNNGIYALILTLPFLIISCRNIWKKIVILFGLVLVTIMSIQGPIFKVLNINYSNPAEAFAVPMQQFARISKFDSDRLSEEDKKIIQEYFPAGLEKVSNDYVPWFADPTKWNFSSEAFSQDKKNFILQYFKFAFEFPIQTISALVFNTGNNYSPNFNVWGILEMYGEETQDIYPESGEEDRELYIKFMNEYPIQDEPLVNLSFLDTLNEEILKVKPVISNIFSNIGLYFWILILCFAYCIYKKQYRNMVMLLPILGLWITAIAAPMVDLRYVYSMFLITPLFIGVILRDSKDIKENENER